MDDCAHDGCRCKVDAGWCSSHCKEHSGETGSAEGDCGCGHPECSPVSPRSPVADNPPG